MYAGINNFLKVNDIDTAKLTLKNGIEIQRKIIVCVKNNKQCCIK